jgi:hypothetical protein
MLLANQHPDARKGITETLNPLGKRELLIFHIILFPNNGFSIGLLHCHLLADRQKAIYKAMPRVSKTRKKKPIFFQYIIFLYLCTNKQIKTLLS